MNKILLSVLVDSTFLCYIPHCSESAFWRNALSTTLAKEKIKTKVIAKYKAGRRTAHLCNCVRHGSRCILQDRNSDSLQGC